MVPVVRDAERMNLAEIEKNIIDYGKKARDGKLGLEELSKHVDSLIVILNEKLEEIYEDDSMLDWMKYADDVLNNAVAGIAEIINVPGHINVDFNDVKTIVVACDVTREPDCAHLANAALEAFGGIDVLVNVAGGSGPIGKTGAETTQAAFEDIVQLNMTGCFNTIHAVLPTMIARKSGKIVNVGGTFGMRGRAGRMAYSASKWGLRGITKSTAIEVGPYNINVNCVAPGMIETDMLDEAPVAFEVSTMW